MYKWVLDCSDLSPNEKILLSLIRSLYEKYGKNDCFDYSKVLMAKWLNWSIRTINLYLHQLRDKKYIKFCGKNGTSTHFFICNNETEQIIQELSQKWHK